MRAPSALAFALAAAPLLACDKPAPPPPAPAATATTSSPPSGALGSATATASAAASAAGLPAGPDGGLTVAWKVASAGTPKVAVSLVVGDETLAIGPLDATSDDGPAAPTACAMKNSAAGSRLACGRVPTYNYFTATIAGGALVVTKTIGLDGVPSEEKTVEVLRKPTAATKLTATGPASPALFGECRPGYVQETATSPCLRQCLKGTECAAKDTCTMLAVTGTDGPHRVHACVPPRK